MVLLCNMLCQDFSITVFLSETWYFYHKTHISWDVIISSTLRLLLKVSIWYRCQENYYHDDGEQLGFYKKVHIIQFIWQKLCSRGRQSHIQNEEIWVRWIVIKQVNYYFPLTFPERHCNREKLIVMYYKKMKAKCMKEDVWKSFATSL